MSAREQEVASDALYSIGHWLLGQARERDAADLFRVFALAAPADERAWLGLSECHARLGQPQVALEMAGTGSVLADAKVRLHLQRARLLRELDRDDDAVEASLRAAEDAVGDEEMEELVRGEQGET